MGTYNHVERGPKSGGPADAVVLLLHGMGGNGERTIVHADTLGEAFPNAHFYAPDASNPYIPAVDPKTFDMDERPTPGRFMWYSRYSEETRETGLYETGSLLDTYIDECVAAHGLDRSRAVIVGISQGAIVSDFCVPRLGLPIAAAISHSGYLFSPDSLAIRRSQIPQFKKEITNRLTPHCLIHGLKDDRLPWQTGLEAATAFEESGIPVEFHLLAGLQHAILDDRSMTLIIEFGNRHLYGGASTKAIPSTQV
jgi:phospholipase/carboxylesterase